MSRLIKMPEEGSSDWIPDGQYEDTHFSAYCQIPFLNASTLKFGWESMKHMKAAIDGTYGYKKSKALKVGRAIHSKLLEPAEFAKIPISTPCNARLKSGKRIGQECGAASSCIIGGDWRCKTHSSGAPEFRGDFLSPAEHSNINKVYENVRRHRVISLLREAGGIEKTFIRTINGRKVKGRVDKDIATPTFQIPPTVADVKKVTPGRGGQRWFSKQVEEYNYDMSAAWYVDGLFALDGILREFLWIIVEDGEPYDVNVIQADEETLRIGRAKYQWLLGRIEECEATGVWPGYSQTVRYGGLSSQAKKRWRWVLTAGVNDEYNG